MFKEAGAKAGGRRDAQSGCQIAPAGTYLVPEKWSDAVVGVCKWSKSLKRWGCLGDLNT